MMYHGIELTKEQEKIVKEREKIEKERQKKQKTIGKNLRLMEIHLRNICNKAGLDIDYYEDTYFSSDLEIDGDNFTHNLYLEGSLDELNTDDLTDLKNKMHMSILEQLEDKRTDIDGLLNYLKNKE